MARARLPASVFFSIAALAALFQGCLEAGDPPGAPAPIVAELVRSLAWGARSGLAGEREAVLASSAEWAAFWREHAPGSPDPAPIVDFASERVVAVALGERSNGCFGVRVTSASTDLDARSTTVNVTERVPQPREVCTQALVTPFHFAAIPARDSTVTFAWSVGDFEVPPGEEPRDEPPPDDPAPGAVEWRPLAAGQHSGIEDARRVALATQAEYDATWKEHAAYAEPRPEAPHVEFARERVVAAWLGPKPNGCWHADVTDVTRDGATLVVHLSIVKPPPDGACADVITHPFVAIAVPQGEESIAWNETEKTA